jgi:hypothetical protein
MISGSMAFFATAMPSALTWPMGFISRKILYRFPTPANRTGLPLNPFGHDDRHLPPSQSAAAKVL